VSPGAEEIVGVPLNGAAFYFVLPPGRISSSEPPSRPA
jgi:hypothetical protein